jgi:hypothetical protein
MHVWDDNYQVSIEGHFWPPSMLSRQENSGMAEVTQSRIAAKSRIAAILFPLSMHQDCKSHHLRIAPFPCGKLPMVIPSWLASTACKRHYTYTIIYSLSAPLLTLTSAIIDHVPKEKLTCIPSTHHWRYASALLGSMGPRLPRPISDAQLRGRPCSLWIKSVSASLLQVHDTCSPDPALVIACLYFLS